MQPYHAADDGRWAEKRIGRKRCETTYAFRDLLDRGTWVAFGSDWPVASLSPLLGIEAAVTRQTLDGKNPDGWVPRQKITVEEALRAYTQGSARAGFDEERLGRIQPGHLADLVVLAEDILRIDPSRIGEVRVDLTVVDGKIVYERNPRGESGRSR
jgi:predicted amidohydrolase YtcJ